MEKPDSCLFKLCCLGRSDAELTQPKQTLHFFSPLRIRITENETDNID